MAAPTPEQKKAANYLKRIGKWSADTVRSELNRTLANFNTANTQAQREATEEQNKATARTEVDRFAQLKKLQQSAQSARDAAGGALQGSNMSSFAEMLRERNNADTTESMGASRENRQAIQGELDKELGQNITNANEARSSATSEIRKLMAEISAGLNNINPALYTDPKNINLGAMNWTPQKAHTPKKVGYMMSDSAVRAGTPMSPSGNGGGGYFDQLMSSYRRRA